MPDAVLLQPAQLAIAAGASMAAGAVNALAGGGTLLTFPMLTALGLPALDANITNTVALCPGHFGATLAQRRMLEGQVHRLRVLLPAGALGGVLGGLLLVATSEQAFRQAVPLLLLTASLLLAVQDRVRSALARRRGGHAHPRLLPFGATVAAVYGGYFGAGLGVVLLATLGMLLDDSLPRLNALKQVVSVAANVAAAAFFVGSSLAGSGYAGAGHIHWPVTVAMAAGGLAGGFVGGRLASRTNPGALRRVMVALGLVLSLVYFLK